MLKDIVSVEGINGDVSFLVTIFFKHLPFFPSHLVSVYYPTGLGASEEHVCFSLLCLQSLDWPEVAG